MPRKTQKQDAMMMEEEAYEEASSGAVPETAHVEMQQDDDDEEMIMPVDKLQDEGISAADIGKLKAGGIHSVSALTMRTHKELCNIKGISDAKIAKMMEASEKLLGKGQGGFVSGTAHLAARQKVCHITTGSKVLDEMLGGGIETMSITEAFGEFRTGKTQLAHTLCVTTQLPRAEGGAQGCVAYIDTEGTFRPEKLSKICERYGVQVEDVLDNILYARAYTSDSQMKILAQMSSLMLERPFKLVIIDSVTALFRVDYSGRGELAARQQKMGQMLNHLQKLAAEFNVAVFYTNQVMSDPGGGAMFVTDPKKPIGGHVLAHASTTRLYLRKGRGEQRIAKLYDSPNMPEADALYELSDMGIKDAAE